MLKTWRFKKKRINLNKCSQYDRRETDIGKHIFTKYIDGECPAMYIEGIDVNGKVATIST